MADKGEVEALAEYYDQTDLSDVLAGAEPDDEEVVDPFVTTSLRLPLPVLQAVREVARSRGRGVTATQVMREWIETGLAAEQRYADATVPLSAVRAALAELIEHSSSTVPHKPLRRRPGGLRPRSG